MKYHDVHSKIMEDHDGYSNSYDVSWTTMMYHEPQWENS